MPAAVLKIENPDLSGYEGVDSAILAKAWDYYLVARTGVWAAGDETGVRAFLPATFEFALKRATEEIEKDARWAAHKAEEHRVAAELAAKINAGKEALAAALTREQRSARIVSIYNELAFLPYRPLSVDIGRIEDELNDELKFLQAADEAHRVAEFDRIIADSNAAMDRINDDARAKRKAFVEDWMSSPLPGEPRPAPARTMSDLDSDPALWTEWDKAIEASKQPAADALWSDGATDRAIERVA